MDVEALRAQVKTKVDRKLMDFYQKKRKEALSIQPQLGEIIDQIADFTTRGGKRTRALCCVLGYWSARFPSQKDITNVELPNRVWNFMLAIELFQAFCLIHDDVLDKDMTRRGKPTIHEYFRHQRSLKPLAVSQKDDEKERHVFDNAQHFGSSMAILVGDLVYAWAEQWRDRGLTGLSAVRREELNEIYGRMREEVIFGQALDIWHQAGDVTLPQETINTLKTAWYSVIRPLQLGASLAGGTQDVRIFLEEYGMPVGRAYQLKDDYLDGEIDRSSFNKLKESYIAETNRAIESRPLSPAVRMLLTGFASFALARGA